MLSPKSPRQFLIAAMLSLGVTAPTTSYAFLDALKKNMESLGNQLGTTSGQKAQAGSGSQPAQGSVDAICSRVLGAPYEGTFPPGVSAEELVAKYFNVTVDLGQKLRDGISIIRPGVMPNIEHMLRDLNDTDVRRLGEAVVTAEYPREVLDATLRADYAALARQA